MNKFLFWVLVGALAMELGQYQDLERREQEVEDFRRAIVQLAESDFHLTWMSIPTKSEGWCFYTETYRRTIIHEYYQLKVYQDAIKAEPQSYPFSRRYPTSAEVSGNEIIIVRHVNCLPEFWTCMNNNFAAHISVKWHELAKKDEPHQLLYDGHGPWQFGADKSDPPRPPKGGDPPPPKGGDPPPPKGGEHRSIFMNLPFSGDAPRTQKILIEWSTEVFLRSNGKIEYCKVMNLEVII